MYTDDSIDGKVGTVLRPSFMEKINVPCGTGSWQAGLCTTQANTLWNLKGLPNKQVSYDKRINHRRYNLFTHKAARRLRGRFITFYHKVHRSIRCLPHGTPSYAKLRRRFAGYQPETCWGPRKFDQVTQSARGPQETQTLIWITYHCETIAVPFIG